MQVVPAAAKHGHVCHEKHARDHKRIEPQRSCLRSARCVKSVQQPARSPQHKEVAQNVQETAQALPSHWPVRPPTRPASHKPVKVTRKAQRAKLHSEPDELAHHDRSKFEVNPQGPIIALPKTLKITHTAEKFVNQHPKGTELPRRCRRSPSPEPRRVLKLKKSK